MTSTEAEQKLLDEFLGTRRVRLLTDFYRLEELGIKRTRCYEEMSRRYALEPRSVQRMVLQFEDF